ncbi:MAG: hypothetical protein ACD_48C00598G0005, partial [uncultured bacterium]
RQKIVTEFVTIIPFDDASAQQLTKQLEQLHTSADITDFLMKVTADMYEAREKQVTPEILRQVEQWVSLQVIDNLWMEHLDAIDDLREGIGLRGYGQRDPLVEYKNEAFNMFERLISSIDSEIVHRIFKVQVQLAPQAPRSQVPTPAPMPVAPQGLQPSIVRRIQTNAPQQSVAQPVVNSSNKLGRNDPCWCGSGKKWKKCHYPQAG